MNRYFFYSLILMIFSIADSFSKDKSLQSTYSDDTLRVIEKVYLHTDRSSFYPGEDIWFKAYLIDASDRSLTNQSNNLHVELISPDSKIIYSRIVRMKEGLGKGDFHLANNIRSGFYQLRAYTNHMRNFGDELFFHKNIMIINSSDIINASIFPVTDSENKLDITFFPESGSLIETTTSIVAFKATDFEGKGCNVTGKIYSSDGEMITPFFTSFNGMGTFSLNPVPGLRYYATAQNKKGDLLKFEIPESNPKGIVMNIAKNSPSGLLLVFKTNPETLTDIEDHNLNLTVSFHKMVLSTYSFKINSLNSSFDLSVDSLPEGVVMLSLLDSEQTPLCERLVFINKQDKVNLKVETNKSEYQKRDSVSVRISFEADSSNNSPNAFLSLSASEELLSDNFSGSGSTISSWFLLESDVRGPVENPSYYFDPSNSERLKDLDLLLLTQGWRDFKWKYQNVPYPTENGFTISGKVRKKFVDAPLVNSTVSIGIFGSGKPILGLFNVDSSGRFSVNGLDISGKRKLIASVTDEKDNLKGLLLIDSLNYLPAEIKSIRLKTGSSQNNENFYLSNNTPDLNSHDKNSLKKYIQYVEFKAAVQKKYGLSDTIQLGEINVIAKRVDNQESARSRSIHYLSATPDKELVITPDFKGYNDVYQLVSSRFISPVKLSRFISHGMQNPIFLIDGMRASADDLKALSVNWIERIDVLDNPASFASFGTMVNIIDKQGPYSNSVSKISLKDTVTKSDGVVSVILRRDYNPRQLFHSVNIGFSGYDEPRIFYSPKHHTTLEKDYKPDLRSTLDWLPDIEVENNKDYFVNFYNTDNSSTVEIIVEGITSTGIPLTISKKYVVH